MPGSSAVRPHGFKPGSYPIRTSQKTRRRYRPGHAQPTRPHNRASSRIDRHRHRQFHPTDAPIASSESSPTSSIDTLPSSTSSSIETLPSSSTSEASESGPGPQTPACGIVEVTTDEVISGVQFPIGRDQINTFGMSCEEVMGDDGFFSKFLQLADDDELPEPWSYLEGVVGAPKFVTGPSVGFRVERVAN